MTTRSKHRRKEDGRRRQSRRRDLVDKLGLGRFRKMVRDSSEIETALRPFDGVSRREWDQSMQVRWKAPKVGDVVRVKDGEMYFHLPVGLPDGTDCILVGRDSGVYIVHALGEDWKIPFQCVVHEEEEFLDGDGFGSALLERYPRVAVHMKKQWLNRWDRRVQKAQAAIDRMQAAEARRRGGRVNAV